MLGNTGVLGMWNQAATTAVLALVGVIVGAGLQYASSRALEGRKQLILEKSLAYVDFFKAVSLIAQHGSSKDHMAMAADAKVRACIFGSPTVIRALRDFEKSGASLTSPQSCEVITELLMEMRKDTGMNCKGISEDDLQRVLFGDGYRQGTASAVPKVQGKEGGFSR
jgi:hypothetical protein